MGARRISRSSSARLVNVLIAVGAVTFIWVALNLLFNQASIDFSRFSALAWGLLGAALLVVLDGNRALQTIGPRVSVADFVDDVANAQLWLTIAVLLASNHGPDRAGYRPLRGHLSLSPHPRHRRCGARCPLRSLLRRGLSGRHHHQHRLVARSSPRSCSAPVAMPFPAPSTRSADWPSPWPRVVVSGSCSV